jgi:hypothetical protein
MASAPNKICFFIRFSSFSLNVVGYIGLDVSALSQEACPPPVRANRYWPNHFCAKSDQTAAPAVQKLNAQKHMAAEAAKFLLTR